MLKFLVLFGLISLTVNVNSQPPTIGLLFNNDNASEGYTLFTPEKNNDAYLINNCGEVVNSWTFSERPGLSSYLLENGNILHAGRDSLEIRDWDNNLVWSYAMDLNGLVQHHDIEPLPNGNILCLLRDNYTPTEIIAEGRDPGNIGTQFKLDRLVELSPVGTNDATIVWEWKFIDHFIQDFDNTKDNFGVVIDHPELIDLNFDNTEDVDFTHVNGIDYNADLDQIILSTRHLGEIHLIDHSTTTAEAAGHSGGNSNMGGDFLWRWGNPQVYDQGLPSDQKLFLQHDCKWVENGFDDAGKISVFNNDSDGSGTFSSIHLIEPDETAGVYAMMSGAFLPLDFDFSWNGNSMGQLVHETKKSGVQTLSNGNMLICETSKGQFTEIDQAGNQLWVYRNPTGLATYAQYTPDLEENNTIFRANKYLPNYPGFSGKDLSGQGIIEDQNEVSTTCLGDANLELYGMNEKNLKSNVIVDQIVFEKMPTSLTIFDLKGRIVSKLNQINSNTIQINLGIGMYILEIENQEGTVSREKIIVQ